MPFVRPVTVQGDPEQLVLVETSGTPLLDAEGQLLGYQGVDCDITARARDEAILAARARLSDYALNHSLDELLTQTLDEAELLTGSTIGFFHFVEADQNTLSLQTWSSNTLRHLCTAEGQGQHYPVDQAGVWADALRERRPLIHNDYPSLPHRHGLPPGHAPVLRQLVVPVLRNEQVVALLGVGNKLNPYGPVDIESASRLATLAWDIVLARRAEKERHETEARYRIMLDQAGDAVFLHDRNGRVLDANQKACLNLGDTREELLALSVPEIDPDAISPGKEVSWAKILAGEQLTFESRHRRKDGTTFPVEVTLGPVRLPSGQLILGIARDITARQAADAALRESERRYRILADSGQALIWTSGLDKKCDYFNLPWLAFTGRTLEQEQGDGWGEGVHPADLARCVATYTQAFDRQECFSMDYRLLHHSGKFRWIMDDGSPRYDSQGKFLGYIGYCLDIHEKQELKAQFLRAQRLESIGQLASGIAHDLNNILTPVIMIIPLLRDDLKNPATQDLLDTVAQSAQRGADIVKQILTFSRGLVGEKAPVQTRHLIKEVGKIVQETFSRTIQIQTRVDKDLWLVEGDASQLHQILMNLVVNARDAMPNGGKLMLSAQNIVVEEALAGRCPGAKPGPHVLWLASDTGTGMTAEVQERMYDPFFTTKPPGQGTGLGLFTTLGIVQGHGGFLQVESGLGEGTTFHIYLPAHPEPESFTHQPTVALPDGQGDLVLVVDDEESIRNVLRHTLEMSGFRVVTASDGVEGIALLQNWHRKIQLLLVDLMMPRQDGFAVIREARRLAPAMRIIAASGMCDATLSEKLQRLGVTHFLPKPFTTSSLATTLRACQAQDVNIGRSNEI